MCSVLFNRSYASALIAVDSANVNVGTIFKEKTDTISHVFIILNTGDEALKIIHVRPGCGCAAVKYDSIIPPKEKGEIKVVITFDEYFAGIFSSIIKVVSNAANAEVLKLTLKAKIISVVTPSREFLQLAAQQDKMVNEQITFTTDKKDLKIVDLFFEQSSEKSTDLWNSPAISIQYKQLSQVYLTKNGSFTCIVNFAFEYMCSDKMSGYFTFKTNHPQKEQIIIGGVIGPFEKNGGKISQSVKNGNRSQD